MFVYKKFLTGMLRDPNFPWRPGHNVAPESYPILADGRARRIVHWMHLDILHRSPVRIVLDLSNLCMCKLGPWKNNLRLLNYVTHIWLSYYKTFLFIYQIAYMTYMANIEFHWCQTHMTDSANNFSRTNHYFCNHSLDILDVLHGSCKISYRQSHMTDTSRNA